MAKVYTAYISDVNIELVLSMYDELLRNNDFLIISNDDLIEILS